MRRGRSRWGRPPNPRAWLAAATLAGVALAGPAYAAGPPQITVQAGARQVEVGEPFNVEMTATVDQQDARPDDAELAPPPGITVLGQSSGTQMQVVQGASGMTVRIGMRATWQLAAQKPGRFTIPAPTVVVEGKRYAGTPVTIEVVPATGRPRQRPSNNPFLMPGGPSFNFSFPFGGGSSSTEEDEGPRVDPELALRSARDPNIFLHAVADKKTAVVGQQIAVTLYVYLREPRYSSVSNHDAPLADFLRVPLGATPGTEKSFRAMVGDQPYLVERVDRQALFPLHAGDLHTGSWRWEFRRGRERATLERQSEDLVLHVTEPPRAGRPPGYTLGDVGQFTLSATVEPRRITQGSEVAVRLRLAGTGNLPQSLRVPERTGVEWLEPEKKESIEPQNGLVTGSRTFGYVVRIKESGSVDLGEVTLPYWDPIANGYQVARAVLGKVEVSPSMPVGPRAPEPQDQPAPDPFVAIPAPRAALGAWEAPRQPRLIGATAWGLMAAPPLLVGLASLGAGAIRRAKERRALAKDDPAALAQKALAEARRAEAAGDTKALAAALERAVHLSIEGATGLKSRGVMAADLPDELAERGVSPALAEAAVQALAACETVRFDPSPSDRTTQDLSARVRALVSDLGRRRGFRTGETPNPPPQAP